MLRKLYYKPENPSAFGTLDKLQTASLNILSRSRITDWLQEQPVYTLHRPVRKTFPRNPYRLDNIIQLWEADLLDLQALSKYNDGIRYILVTIGAFSKFVHTVPLLSKGASHTVEAFESIFSDSRYSRGQMPLCPQTDKGKVFLNKQIQDLLKGERIEFRVCRDPTVKCSVVERVQRTLREKLKYFTFKNTHRYVNVLQKLVNGYNNTVHRTTGFAPGKVSEKNILAVWKMMNRDIRRRIKIQSPKFRVGQHVRISKQKARFAKAATQNYSTEIFEICKVIARKPRTLYEIRDLRGVAIVGQFMRKN